MPTIALNAKIGAPSQLTNHPFNSYCNFNGMVLGASSSGVARLMHGNSDDGTQITASLSPHKTDLGIDKDKRVIFLYFGFYSDGNVLVDVSLDDGQTYQYTCVVGKTGLQMARVKIGEGMIGRYINLKITNTNGERLKIDSAEILVSILR